MAQDGIIIIVDEGVANAESTTMNIDEQRKRCGPSLIPLWYENVIDELRTHGVVFRVCRLLVQSPFGDFGVIKDEYAYKQFERGERDLPEDTLENGGLFARGLGDGFHDPNIDAMRDGKLVVQRCRPNVGEFC